MLNEQKCLLDYITSADIIYKTDDTVYKGKYSGYEVLEDKTVEININDAIEL